MAFILSPLSIDVARSIKYQIVISNDNAPKGVFQCHVEIPSSS